MIDLKKIKQSYGTDLKKEVEGNWFPLTMIEGCEVKVARAGNPNYMKLMRKLYKRFTKQLRRGKDVPQEAEEKINMELLVNTILLDWKGMPGEKGKDVPFSIEMAKLLLGDPELKELKDEIVSYSEDFEAYKAEEEEALEKNLETT
jgi:hypothetical protein